MADAARILDEALALDVAERATLARELIASLDGIDADADAAWTVEIRRRIDDVEAGTASVEDWEAVRLRLRDPARR
jgi:putative addiction module component (TIGR02574 family)